MAPVSEHHVVTNDDAEASWFLGCLVTVKGDGARTGGTLGIAEILHPPGFATPRHVHHADDEAFYVLSGSLRGYCGDQRWEATAGSFVWLPRDLPHGYAVVGDEPLRTLAIVVPAGVERFFVEAGEPAEKRVLPPASFAPDIPKMVEVANRHNVETLGPPEP